jgi:glycerophosphoryl diester phosphodiesterase
MIDRDEVHFQAHRGAVDEAPENTLPAFRHAWRLRGAIPETDVRTTADGALICLHDATLARTTNAPAPLRDRPVSQLSLAEVRACDAGVCFGADFAGATVPTFEEVLAELTADAGRRLYVEPKDVELSRLRRAADEYGCADRFILVSASQQVLGELAALFPGAPTMTWCGGAPSAIMQRFETLAQTGFAYISHLQLHLRERAVVSADDVNRDTTAVDTDDVDYLLSDEYLRDAHRRLAAAGVELQLCPWVYTATSLRRLLSIGVRWFVADAPAHFSQCLEEAL